MLKEYIVNRLRGTANIRKLKKNGLLIGENVFVGKGTFIDPSHCNLITIGNNVILSSNVHILAHDASTKNLLGYTKIGQVKIMDDAFVGANAIILPGVSVGEKSIVGAGSVVTKCIPNGEVWAGNPANYICTTDEYKEKFNGVNRNCKLMSKNTDIKLELNDLINENFLLIE